MNLVGIACNACGAKLKASRTTKFVTCTQCNADLTVHFEDDAAFTEVRSTGAETETETEIARIERAWRAERDGLMPKGKRGQSYVPTRAQGWGSIAAGGGFVVFGIIFYAAAPKSTSIGVFGLGMSVVSACAAVVMGFVRMGEAGRFKAARAAYDERIAEARAKVVASRRLDGGSGREELSDRPAS